MVVAPQSEAADVALEVLEQGGNAFDAAVAGAFAQGVVDPHRSGIGGFGAATLIDGKTGAVETVSYYGRAGEKATEEMWADIHEGPAPDGFGYILQGKVNDVGYKSIALPGMVAGMGAIHARFGALPWSTLLEGPAELARRGFLVGPAMATFWRRPGLFGRVSTGDRLGWTAAGRKIWLADGQPPSAGDVVQLPDLARTYERIAEAGARDFYEGALAEEIARDFEKNDALVTRDDLAHFRPLFEPPVAGAFQGHEILSSPLPGGGVALIQALRLFEMNGREKMALNSPAYVDLLARIFRSVQADRNGVQSDPAFGSKSPEELLSEEYLAAMLSDERLGASLDPVDTTEIVVADSAGNAVVLCHSLGYGSGVFTDGLGFMYNNCMSGFDPTPGRLGSIAPGKARSTAIAQTVVKRAGRPALILGAPGGSHITAGLTQALINYLRFGLDLQDAVCRPRLDAYHDTLVLESRMPYKLEDALGHKWEVKRSPSPFGMVGRVYAIAFTDAGLKPGYDPGEPANVRETDL
jgi:gamma-glutamyltranspeptidase/glutathione hydrolase